MCGRYTLKSDAAKLAEVFDARVEVALEPRYNIAPTQPVPVVRVFDEGGAAGPRRLGLVRWGLVPSWADDVSIGNRMINARAETVASRPAFRAAVRYRRCLLPADGFYEWKKLDGRRKQPHLVRMADEEPFAMAGLWEHWQDASGNELESCCVLTTAANEMMASIHDRMPVVLDRSDYALWLDPRVQDAQRVTPLLRPYPAERMMAIPVSTHVNNPRNEDPACVEPITG